MICKLCGKDIIQKVDIKDGFICNWCFDKLPKSFKESKDRLTLKQIEEAKTCIRKAYSKPWLKCESIGICDKSIQIDNWEIQLCDIRSISLNFHPKNNGSKQGYAYGILTIVIDVNTPEVKMVMEEPFLATEIPYYINKKEIIYSYPTKLQQIFTNLQSVIDDQSYNMSKFDRSRYRDEEEEKRKQQERQRRQEQQRQQERQRQYQQQKRQEQQKQSQQQKQKNNPQQHTTEFEKAKALYKVEMPYTKEELNKKKKILLKKYHPDNGGDIHIAVEINSSYELLLKFAED